MLEVQCEVSTVCVGLGSHVIGWCWSTVLSTQRSRLPGHFQSTSCFLQQTSFMEMLTSFSSRICTCPHCQKNQNLLQ
ncbi:hypothetical protein PO909_020972 [Leuciscus waleckii]